MSLLLIQQATEQATAYKPFVTMGLQLGDLHILKCS